MLPRQMQSKKQFLIVFLSLAILIPAIIFGGKIVLAQPASQADVDGSPMHPTFALLDESGTNVLESGNAVSTMETCGACHNSDFIAQHSFHADVGLSDFSSPGETDNGRAWDTSTGLFGKWDPLSYRYLSPPEDDLLDLGTAEWIMSIGLRHVGGGPAVYSRSGERLNDVESTPGDPETNVLDPLTGEPTPWDWEASGVVEMNCFLCHTPSPNNEARIQALQEGKFQWANTATLLGSGIVDDVGGEYRWTGEAFNDNGELLDEFVNIQDPTNENCGNCHGLVHTNVSEPLVMTDCTPSLYRTRTTGQIISPQRLSDTGMNLYKKEDLSRTWDIHAERLLQCTDCHFSLNNPVYYQETDETQPDHLLFDPRRLEIGEYLYQPLHEFARGESAQGTIAPELKDTMRRCESCHSVEGTHSWLPYQERHMQVVSCETCHIPHMYSSAYQQYDWTVLGADVSPASECRGTEGEPGSLKAFITGYDPAWLMRQNIDGEQKIAPYNLVTSWYWVYGDPERPVRLVDLEAAWLEGDHYPDEVMQAFDSNANGIVDEAELVIDSPEKEALIAGRLQALGLENPRIAGEIQPYSINHNVTTGEWAIQDCQTCHSNDSRITQPILLASYVPADVMPEIASNGSTDIRGEIYRTEQGELYLRPLSENEDLYVLGHNSVGWIDLAGSLLFVGVLMAVTAHGGYRYYQAVRSARHNGSTKKVYMYTVYERFWHWLQTFVIVALLFTGLIIHKPDTFGIFSFRYIVLVHNILAGILLVNAGLSLFYHLASGEIRQYIPRPHGFFDEAIEQAIYYLRGIFKGDQHPFEKTPKKKLNPLQQITYFGILNVLLPLQVITGALMWGVQQWPSLAARLGGLPFLAPFHTLIAWLFASFIVGHVYLTTTGYQPLSSIKAMMYGWDEVETPIPAEENLIHDNIDTDATEKKNLSAPKAVHQA